MILRATLCGLLLFCFAGCASVPKANIAANSQAAHLEAEIRLADAGRAMDSLNEQTGVFYSELHGLLDQTEQLRLEPGWNDFEAILRYSPSLQEAPTEEQVPPEAMPLLEEWGKTWNQPWQQMFSRYQTLSDRCIIAEARRIALVEKLLAVQAKYIGATMIELTAGGYEQGKAIYGMVEVLDKTKQELESYRVNEVGLY